MEYGLSFVVYTTHIILKSYSKYYCSTFIFDPLACFGFFHDFYIYQNFCFSWTLAITLVPLSWLLLVFSEKKEFFWDDEVDGGINKDFNNVGKSMCLPEEEGVSRVK